MLPFPVNSPQSLLSVPVYLAAGERASPRTGTSLLLQHPDPWAQILSHFLPSFFSLLLLWVLSVCARIFLVLPGDQGPRLINVQLGLCENGSIRRCIFDAFMGRGELHTLLCLCCLDSSPEVLEIRTGGKFSEFGNRESILW